MKVLSVNNIRFKGETTSESVDKKENKSGKALLYGTSCAVIASTVWMLARTGKIQKKLLNTPASNDYKKRLESMSMDFEIKNFSDNSNVKSLDELSGLENVKEFFNKYLVLANNPEIAKEHNIENFSSILFWGVPGTGKTSAAKGIAKKLNADYIQMDKEFFDSMFVSEGPKRLAQMIEQIEQHAKKYPERKIVVFMDEIDGTITIDTGSAAKHSDDLINTLKRGMTYLQEECDNIIFIGATNKDPTAVKSDNTTLKLNPAILSRFKYQMEIDLPNKDALKDAWKNLMVTSSGKNKFSEKQYDIIADKFHELGMSFRDISIIADKLNREDAVEFCSTHSYDSCKNLIKVLRNDEKIGYDPIQKTNIDINKKEYIISKLSSLL